MSYNLSQYITCPECGVTIPIKRSGRKKLNIPFKNICEALRLYRDIGEAAKELDCSVGYIYHVCKEKGTTPRDVMEIKVKE